MNIQQQKTPPTHIHLHTHSQIHTHPIRKGTVVLARVGKQRRRILICIQYLSGICTVRGYSQSSHAVSDSAIDEHNGNMHQASSHVQLSEDTEEEVGWQLTCVTGPAGPALPPQPESRPPGGADPSARIGQTWSRLSGGGRKRCRCRRWGILRDKKKKVSRTADSHP
jgi:hypothetical protein